MSVNKSNSLLRYSSQTSGFSLSGISRTSCPSNSVHCEQISDNNGTEIPSKRLKTKHEAPLSCFFQAIKNRNHSKPETSLTKCDSNLSAADNKKLKSVPIHCVNEEINFAWRRENVKELPNGTFENTSNFVHNKQLCVIDKGIPVPNCSAGNVIGTKIPCEISCDARSTSDTDSDDALQEWEIKLQEGIERMKTDKSLLHSGAVNISSGTSKEIVLLKVETALTEIRDKKIIKIRNRAWENCLFIDNR